jgi:hypothetical protein
MVPPRLHVLLARRAPVGVVLRRGPSRAVCAIGWDRDRDTFELGQWLRGRIYERRSDLSPDGRYMIYFAMDGRWSSRTRGAWTAISIAPHLKAIALYAKGDCWNGGGLFVDNRSYWLNDGYGHVELRPDGRSSTIDDTGALETTTLVERALPAPYATTWGGECWGVYFNRLERDGWTLRPELAIGASGARTIVFEKPLEHGWKLRKLAHASIGKKPEGQGVYHDEHELVHASGSELPRPDWEWAEHDGDRLVWAERGKLWAGELEASRPGDRPRLRADPIVRAHVLRDFSAMTFEARRAPY